LQFFSFYFYALFIKFTGINLDVYGYYFIKFIYHHFSIDGCGYVLIAHGDGDHGFIYLPRIFRQPSGNGQSQKSVIVDLI
jgi:hypothetical protein